MKVNLNYSVELNEVLSEIEKLYAQHRQKFEKEYNMYSSTMPRPLTNYNLEGALSAFGDLQETISAFDIRLGELRGILNGYENILKNGSPKEPPPDTPPEEIPDEVFLEDE